MLHCPAGLAHRSLSLRCPFSGMKDPFLQDPEQAQLLLPPEGWRVLPRWRWHLREASPKRDVG